MRTNSGLKDFKSIYMKRVLCIYDGPLPGDVPGCTPIKAGVTYVALEEFMGLGSDNKLYRAYEIQGTDRRFGYQIERFVDAEPAEDEVLEEELEEVM
jgi:hypothetical protein